MAEYRLTPAAQRDVEAIFEYTQSRWGVKQAADYVRALGLHCSELATSPRRAAACDDIRPGYRRSVLRQHVIYFRIEPYGIAVIRILHVRMHAATWLSPPPGAGR